MSIGLTFCQVDGLLNQLNMSLALLSGSLPLFSLNSLSHSLTFPAILGLSLRLVGRPWLYGMILEGRAGLEQVVRHTLADFDNTLAVSGYPNLVDFQGKADEVLMKLDL